MGLQLSAFSTRFIESGARESKWAGRIGRVTRLPVQFGQRPFRTFAAQSAQKVHSNVQMKASLLAGGRLWSQHSQFGRSSSISAS